MAGIEDLIEVYRGENILDKLRSLKEINYFKKRNLDYPGLTKIGKFATDKLSLAQHYASKFPNVIKSAKLPKETVEFGKKLFDKAHFPQMPDHRGHVSRLLIPKKADDKLKVDILKTFMSNAKALSPLAIKGLNTLASLPVATLTMVLQSTPANADEANMKLEDFAKLHEGSTNVDKALPSEPKDI